MFQWISIEYKLSHAGPVSGAKKNLPFSQWTEAIRGDVVLTPEREVGVVRRPYHVGEMRQPNSERVVLGMSLVRPDSFEHELRLLKIQVAEAKKTRKKLFLARASHVDGIHTLTLYFASSQAQHSSSLMAFLALSAFCSQIVLLRPPASAYQASLPS